MAYGSMHRFFTFAMANIAKHFAHNSVIKNNKLHLSNKEIAIVNKSSTRDLEQRIKQVDPGRESCPKG
uniref:Uncharacterized protein n=1 Tax=Globodera pallida TaxID=36090 RepID=A0A183C5G7_GLOPA